MASIKRDKFDGEHEIGRRIMKLRKAANMSQEDLAGAAEIDRSYLSEIENGHKNMSIGTLRKIASALNMALSELIKE